MIGYIYLTINDVNEIIYVGKRQKPKFEKWYKGSGKHLKLAFKKYGKEKFHTYVIEECDSVEKLCAAEKKWIAYYKSLGKELYNIAAGGDGGNNVEWRKLPLARRLEINEKNRQSHLGKSHPVTEETRAKMRASARHYKPITEIEKEKATKRSHLKPILQIDKKSKKVIKEWSNWGEAAEQFREKHGRCAYSHISQCCNGERKSAYGYVWEYV